MKKNERSFSFLSVVERRVKGLDGVAVTSEGQAMEPGAFSSWKYLFHLANWVEQFLTG